MPGPSVLCRQGRTRSRTLEASVLLTAGRQLALLSLAVSFFLTPVAALPLHSLHCSCSSSCQWPCAKSSGPFSHLFLRLCSVGQVSSLLASQALLWLLLPLCSFQASAGPSPHPVYRVLSWVPWRSLSLADGFKELRADLQPQHPFWSSEPPFCYLWARRQILWPR